MGKFLPLPARLGVHPMAAAAAAFLKTLAAEPRSSPAPHPLPVPGLLQAEEHLQFGATIQYLTALTRSHDQPPDPHHGVGHSEG